MRLLNDANRSSTSASPKGFKIADAVSMGATFSSSVFSVAHTPITCIQFVWSAGAAPVGVLQLEGSIDGTNYFAVGSTVAVSGNSGNVQLTDSNAGYLYSRFTYTRTSGTATANAFAEAKGF
jgi:hypothetical protein